MAVMIRFMGNGSQPCGSRLLMANDTMSALRTWYHITCCWTAKAHQLQRGESMISKKTAERYDLRAFALAFLIAALFFVPFLIYNRGYFIFLGDFNVQQIPFYRLAHEAVRSGNLFWNWNTDLGANFIGSYSFYLLFSPFFWLTLPFPNEFVPHLMGPLLILKTACSALTSYWFIKRFVTERSYAVLGSLLYAFSGFMTFNIFFNHFHEVAVFFPLLLVTLEELVENNRRGFFALTVALNCLVNYWFFIGEVVFVLFYVVVRIVTGGWPITVRKFLRIAFESVLGVMMAMFLLLPSVLAIMGNPRTTSDNLLTGWLMWIYGYNQRLPAIIQSLFFPPELPSQPNFFPEMGAKWSSLSAWLPLFSSCGVFAYLRTRKRDFLKRMIILSMVLACIPVFNSLFVLFNHSYYARWFYMPILLMCAATAAALEKREEFDWKGGIRLTAFFTIFIAAAVGLSPKKVAEGGISLERFGIGSRIQIGLEQYPERFWVYVGVSLICLLLTYYLIHLYRNRERFTRVAAGMMVAVIVPFTIFFIIIGKNTPRYDRWFIDHAINGRDKISLPDDGFARSDLYDCTDNLGMFWFLPNIQTFHSIVPASIMEFYPAVGIKRDVSSKPPVEYEALRSLLSVRWLFIDAGADEQEPMSGYRYWDTQNDFNIYENENWLPMGFAYDEAFGGSIRAQLSGELLTRYMLSALYLEDDALIRNMDICEPLTEYDRFLLSADGTDAALDRRRAFSCLSFEIDNRGFTAEADLPKEMLMFFSVPFDKGWRATVNGEPAVIEKANIGFMAVRVPEGPSVIRFEYQTPGLRAGILVSLAGMGLFLLYLGTAGLFAKPRGLEGKGKPQPQSEAPLSELLDRLETLPPPEEPQESDKYPGDDQP